MRHCLRSCVGQRLSSQSAWQLRSQQQFFSSGLIHSCTNPKQTFFNRTEMNQIVTEKMLLKNYSCRIITVPVKHCWRAKVCRHGIRKLVSDPWPVWSRGPGRWQSRRGWRLDRRQPVRLRSPRMTVPYLNSPTPGILPQASNNLPERKFDCSPSLFISDF